MFNRIGDWIGDHLGVVTIGVVGLLIAALVAHGMAEQRFEQQLLAQARTFADTLKIKELMAQRRTADAIAFGAGLVAGSQAGRVR